MSRADELFIQNCKDILAHGVWDTEQEVRPRWEDGTPAHTVKKFGIVNRYDLREEFPVQTIRRMAFKSAVDELLWIWQKKSNNIRDLNSHIWDAWADESGSIGKAYGYQLGVKHVYPEGEMDQVDRVLYDLKHYPASRRIPSSSAEPVSTPPCWTGATRPISPKSAGRGKGRTPFSPIWTATRPGLLRRRGRPWSMRASPSAM